MKKTIIAVAGIFLLMAVVAYAGNIGTDQAAKILKDAVKSAGYVCDVEVGDVDKNGDMDFAIEYKSGGKDDKVIMLLAAITGGVAALLPNLSWKVDKVLVIVGEDLYSTTASKCDTCYKVIQKDGATEDEIKECLQNIWDEKEGAITDDD